LVPKAQLGSNKKEKSYEFLLLLYLIFRKKSSLKMPFGHWPSLTNFGISLLGNKFSFFAGVIHVEKQLPCNLIHHTSVGYQTCSPWI